MLQKILHTLEAFIGFMGATSLFSVLLYVKLAKGVLKVIFKIAIVLLLLAAAAFAVLYLINGGVR